MKDHEINTIIAQACGWTHCRYIEGLHDATGVPPESWKGDLISGLDTAWIPYYCGDLNAMHEAEKMMIANKSLLHFWKYAASLKRHFPNLGDDGYIHATARQRAEAFLRTIGKWVDSPEKEH